MNKFFVTKCLSNLNTMYLHLQQVTPSGRSRRLQYHRTVTSTSQMPFSEPTSVIDLTPGGTDQESCTASIEVQQKSFKV